MNITTSFGSTKTGQLGTDDKQIKVHRRMLSRLHLGNLKNILRYTLSEQSFIYGEHVKEKFRKREISREDEIIQMTLIEFLSSRDSSGDVLIEYNEKEDEKLGIDRRILLRSKITKLVQLDNENIETNCNYCFAINIDKGIIVTVYWNKVNDIHNNLDHTIYQAASKAKGLAITHNLLEKI